MSKPLDQWRKANEAMMKFLNYGQDVKQQAGYDYDFIHACIHRAAPDLADDDIANIIKDQLKEGDLQACLDRELDAIDSQICIDFVDGERGE